MQQETTEHKLITLREVVTMVGFCPATIYSRVNNGLFPMYIKLGRSTRWDYGEVQEWITNKLAQRRSSPEDSK